MDKIKITNEHTEELKENEIFVFGSNLAGRHGAGAAKLAADKFGAEYGVGEGLTGQCYAFPTKDSNIQTLSIASITESASKLYEVVKSNRGKEFVITAVGCGLAGYSATEIAPIFEQFIYQENVSLPKSFIDVLFPLEYHGYKVTDENMQCRGHQFEVGEEYAVSGDISICRNGFHFCKKLSNCFRYYDFNPRNRVFEVIGSGAFDFDDDKVCFEKIKIVKELNWYEVLELCNSGDYNSGNRNSGNRNSGNRNSGHYNSGNYNSGDYNSGNYNSGDYNSGNYNSGNYNSGFFNTDIVKVKIFNIQTDIDFSEIDIPYINLVLNRWICESEMTDFEKENNPCYKSTGGFLKKLTYKESWEDYWGRASDFEKDKILNLPHFDKDIFFEITGINV